MAQGIGLYVKGLFGYLYVPSLARTSQPGSPWLGWQHARATLNQVDIRQCLVYWRCNIQITDVVKCVWLAAYKQFQLPLHEVVTLPPPSSATGVEVKCNSN